MQHIYISECRILTFLFLTKCKFFAYWIFKQLICAYLLFKTQCTTQFYNISLQGLTYRSRLKLHSILNSL